MIDNGTRLRLVIDGVFDGQAGVSGAELSFIPNRAGKAPAKARGGLLDGKPVLLTAVSASPPFVAFRFEVLS